jgi:hypothetical protein
MLYIVNSLFYWLSYQNRIGQPNMKLHPSITAERVLAAVEAAEVSLDNPGFCIACGADADGVEPDARRYTCEACGTPAVYGAEELLLRIA